MDKISSAIKCVNCRNILSSPVLLPCGHSICMSHTNTDCVLCHKCGAEHSNKNYYVNEALAEMIAAQVAAIDFGTEHKEAQKSCSDLSEVITKVDFVLNDSDYYINEMVSELKRRVHLKHEQIKLKVDEETQSILDKLNEYEKMCKENAKTKKSEMQKLKVKFQKELEQWLCALNELKFDENKWKSIQGQSKERNKRLRITLEKLKEEFLLNQYEAKKSEIVLFENIDINSLFQYRALKKKFDSVIIDANMINGFLKLCEFDSTTKKFNLLYRASRDGFGANNFHSSCDNKPETLTIIKSTNGCIFGGYTKATWNSNSDNETRVHSGKGGHIFRPILRDSCTKKDPDAFIFSWNCAKPFKMNIAQGREDYAITCSPSCGPVFGASPNFDILINFTSTGQCDGRSSVGNSYCLSILPVNHHNFFYPLINNQILLAGNTNFAVAEIEVFQLV